MTTKGTGYLIRHVCKQKHSPCDCRGNYWSDRIIENADPRGESEILRLTPLIYAESVAYSDTKDLIAWDFPDGSSLQMFPTTAETVALVNGRR
jgi:hypothetical protein